MVELDPDGSAVALLESGVAPVLEPPLVVPAAPGCVLLALVEPSLDGEAAVEDPVSEPHELAAGAALLDEVVVVEDVVALGAGVLAGLDDVEVLAVPALGEAVVPQLAGAVDVVVEVVVEAALEEPWADERLVAAPRSP